MGIETAIDDLTFLELNKHTPEDKIEEYTHQLKTGDVGLMSEAGVPAVADPGNLIVDCAHRNHYKVEPLVGPSSILMALMASGMNGQSFTFHGYLPVKSPARQKKLKELERDVQQKKQTQIFIEAPYRNHQLLEDIIKACSGGTKLCIASNIATKEAFIKTLPVSQWRKQKLNLHKIPTVFLLG